MMKKALINDLGGKVLHYAEAVKTARGIEVRHSVEVRPCVIGNLNEKDAIRLMNEIGALVAGAKVKEIDMLGGDSDSKGGYIVVRKSEFLIYNTLKEAEEAAEKALEYRHEGAFSIAEVCENVWVEITTKFFKEVVK